MFALFGRLPAKAIALVVGISLLLGGVWSYGKREYQRGKNDQILEQRKADEKAASEIKERIEDATSGIDPDTDIDSILRGLTGPK